MALKRFAMLDGQHRHFVEQSGFQRQRAFRRFGDARRQRRQFVGGKAHRPRHGLAMAEGFPTSIFYPSSACRHAAG